MKKNQSLLKKVILVVSFFFFLNLSAQAPEKMSYQAVIRNASNALVTNQNIGMQVSILQGSATGTAVYVETQTPTSNTNGLVTLEIGNGTVVTGTFDAIDWANGPYFIQTETDPTGGTSYTITGTSQLLSAPYALYAKASGSSTPGPQGPQGIQGLTGPQGPAGNDGANGANGTNGTNGVDGLKSLVKTTTETAGANCANGGTKVESGIDTNNDNTLQATEVTATNYVCNGSNGTNGTNGSNGSNGTNGTNGLKSLVKTTTETAGANCANGGTKVESGIDTNNDNTLQATEVTATNYVCNGSNGTNGTNGANGTNGTNGVGVPIGGTTGQVLAKVNATDYNTQWVTPSGGSPSATALPNAFYAHGYTFNQPAYYTSPFVFQTQNILGGFLTFLTPAATNFTINFSSFDDEALTFELFEVTPVSNNSTFSTTGTALATCNTTAWSSGAPISSSFTYTASAGKILTIKITKTGGGNLTSNGVFYTAFSTN